MPNSVIIVTCNVRVTSRLLRSQASIDIDNMVITFRWLARCTTHHISRSETLRWGSETGSGAQSVWASQCAWVKAVDTSGLHGPACRRSTPRQQRHYHLNDIIWFRAASRQRRSCGRNLLHDDRTNLAFADRAFSHAAPAVWNSLSLDIVSDLSCLATFKRLVKTELL